MMRRARVLLLLACSVLLTLVAAPAFATTVWGDYFGSTVDFLGVQETTNSAGDSEPLFEEPTVVGDQLYFFPSNFTAASNGGPVLDGGTGPDQTAALLEMTLQASLGTYIETIHVAEFGDTFLAGTGTSTTGTFVGMSGVVTVLAADTPGPWSPIDFVAVFNQDTFNLVDDFGTTAWSGLASIDVAGSVAGVTQAMLQVDNFLYATSELDSSSLIQKKTTGGLVITVPEPASLGLLGLGLLGAGLLGRRRDR